MNEIPDGINNALDWLRDVGSVMHPDADAPPLPGIEKLREATRLLTELVEMYPPVIDDREPIAPGDYQHYALQEIE